MSLWCGSCRKEIFGGFGLLYRVLRIEGTLQYPGPADYDPANSAVCEACWKTVPDEEKRTGDAVRSEAESGTDPFVYVYGSADSGRCLFGSKSWSDIDATTTDFTFLRESTVADHLSRARDIINRMEQGQERTGAIAHRAFSVRLVAYLRTCPFKIVGMQCFSYGMVGVQDAHGHGEFDVYFDPSVWKAVNPILWGDSLCPPSLKERGLGVLEGIGMAPPPTSFKELLRFADRTLTRIDGKEGQTRNPIDISVPSDLRPTG